MKKIRMLLILMLIILILTFFSGYIGNKWSKKYCNSTSNLCITAVSYNNGFSFSSGSIIYIYGTRHFHPAFKLFLYKWFEIKDVDELVLDQKDGDVLVYGNGVPERTYQHKQGHAVRVINVIGDPCSFINQKNYSVKAQCSKGDFHY
jgi:hypothetical protein